MARPPGASPLSHAPARPQGPYADGPHPVGDATVSTVDEQAPRSGAVDGIAGLLAAASLVLSALGAGFGILLEIEAHPARVIPVAVVLAIVAGRMSPRHERLARLAVFVAMFAFVVGMTLAVTTENSLV